MCGRAPPFASAKQCGQLQKLHLAISEKFLLITERMQKWSCANANKQK
jgi:hypothetical protein